MSQGMPICKDIHMSTTVHLMVDGKYVTARTSKTKEVELILADEQGEQDSVQSFTFFTCVRETKKYVTFFVTRGSEPYLIKTEGEALKMVSGQQACPSVLSWLEMENIQAGESHYLTTTAGQIGVKRVSNTVDQLCIGGSNPVRFIQKPIS